eukprot:EC785704.1.p1 GENE.EC785704.1~~EC785704.1.p1  ORF type:complete len:133 (+),score=39.93 EC785704.1:22-399(+)
MSGRQAKPVHPCSRNARYISSQVHHQQKLKKQRHKRDVSTSVRVDKFLWLQQVLAAEFPNSMTYGDARAMLPRYIARHDDEIAELEEKRRGRLPLTARESLLREQKRAEEAACMRRDFEFPDVFS